MRRGLAVISAPGWAGMAPVNVHGVGLTQRSQEEGAWRSGSWAGAGPRGAY